VVVRGGLLAWEQYFHGGDAQQRLHLFSVTKSVISALVGIAFDRGLLGSPDQPVMEFFPEFGCPPENPYSLVTLRHLLSMTSGLVWPSGHHGLEPMAERMRRSPDWTRFILSLPVRREEIGTFHYCSAASHLLSAVLTRVSGQSACDFAAAYLFGPLGIAPVTSGTSWDIAPPGVSTGGWGLHLTARELARFGWLYLNNGQWAGKTVVSEAWVRASTQAEGGYGYQWWLRQVAGQSVFAGQGFAGQYLFCVPDLDLAVVVQSHAQHRWPERWEWFAALMGGLIGKP
jgi:CubicO group peptidase (beta-lactamase class C family)